MEGVFVGGTRVGTPTRVGHASQTKQSKISSSYPVTLPIVFRMIFWY